MAGRAASLFSTPSFTGLGNLLCSPSPFWKHCAAPAAFHHLAKYINNRFSVKVVRQTLAGVTAIAVNPTPSDFLPQCMTLSTSRPPFRGPRYLVRTRSMISPNCQKYSRGRRNSSIALFKTVERSCNSLATSKRPSVFTRNFRPTYAARG